MGIYDPVEGADPLVPCDECRCVFRWSQLARIKGLFPAVGGGAHVNYDWCLTCVEENRDRKVLRSAEAQVKEQRSHVARSREADAGTSWHQPDMDTLQRDQQEGQGST